MPFWLLTISCVCTYMSIFPYLQVVSDLIQKKYNLDQTTAGSMFGVPYLISAFASPFLGFMIDRVGRRALMICISSFILICAFTTSLFLPGDDGSKLDLLRCYLGQYSIHCSTIKRWNCFRSDNSNPEHRPRRCSNSCRLN
jgi:MFS family permease